MAVKLLRIEAPHFVAGAVYERTLTGWECTKAAPIVAWMVGKAPSETRDYLKRKGWDYQWVEGTK